MKKLTSHERLMRIFRNEEIDRPALKLWGAAPNADGLLHESYRPVAELAAEKTDLFTYAGGYDLDVFAGAAMADLVEDLAAEQKARVTYDNILRLSDDPDVNDVIKFLREREIVHFQRFGEALQLLREKLNQKNVYYMNPAIDM